MKKCIVYTIKIQNVGTNISEQNVQTHITLPLKESLIKFFTFCLSSSCFGWITTLGNQTVPFLDNYRYCNSYWCPFIISLFFFNFMEMHDNDNATNRLYLHPQTSWIWYCFVPFHGYLMTLNFDLWFLNCFHNIDRQLQLWQQIWWCLSLPFLLIILKKEEKSWISFLCISAPDKSRWNG